MVLLVMIADLWNELVEEVVEYLGKEYIVPISPEVALVDAVLTADLSEAPKAESPSARRGRSRKTFTGGLSWGVDDERLRRAFEEFGEVSSPKIIVDRETGRSRGFGFVTFQTEDEAAAAMRALDGKDLDGRTIRVNEAQERSGGGGRR